jgi:hypothetical protein
MPHRIQRFGVWLLTTPRGALDPRVFREDKRGNWPISIQQRALGIELHKPGIYGRSFARMGNWKGFYLTAVRANPVPKSHKLLRKVKRDLGVHPSAAHRLLEQKKSSRRSGIAVLSAPKLSMLRSPPWGQLLAIVYAKRTASDA